VGAFERRTAQLDDQKLGGEHDATRGGVPAERAAAVFGQRQVHVSRPGAVAPRQIAGQSGDLERSVERELAVAFACLVVKGEAGGPGRSLPENGGMA